MRNTSPTENSKSVFEVSGGIFFLSVAQIKVVWSYLEQACKKFFSRFVTTDSKYALAGLLMKSKPTNNTNMELLMVV